MRLAATLLTAAAVLASPSAAGANARLVFERALDTPHDSTAQIFSAGPGGRGGTLIAASRGGDLPTAPSFSADGSTLVFDRESRLGFASIAIARADGSGERILPGEGRNPSLSPTGRRIVFESAGSVWTEALDGSHRTRVTSGQDPAWSPDGTRIAFIRNGDLYVGTHRLTRDGGNASPSWSPDGTRIAFSHTARSATIDTIGANGRGRRALGPGMQPAWSPDGSRIAFTCPSGVCVMRPDGSGAKLAVKRAFMPAWQPLQLVTSSRRGRHGSRRAARSPRSARRAPARR